MIINSIKKIKVNHSNSKNHNKLQEKNTESLVIPSIFSKPNSSDHIKKVVSPPSILEDRSIINISNINSQITSAKSNFPEEEDSSENNISFKEEVAHEERNDQNQVKDISFCLEEEPVRMEFPCYTSTRKDIEFSFSTVQNINEAKIDDSINENSINSLSQLTIKKELNQQKALPPEDKSSGEAHNNCDIRNKINSIFKKLQSVRSHARNEYIKNTIHSPNILEKHLSGSEYENEAGLFCQMDIQEEVKDEQNFILTEEEYPWEGYTNLQPLRNANLEDHNENNSRDNFECANQHVKWLEDISTPKKNESKKIKDKSSKNKKKTKEEKEYFWITQNKKICPSLQAHLARQYKTSTQKEDWTENNDRNGKLIQDYSDENEDFQDQYLNEERINELTAKKAKFKNGLDNKFSHYQ
ncbi:hypothetical protein O181_130217 [Austropuccinia psidii MF-1]|uniref:Uncharacterized protein n=1 Tax=Austropuccinia psidii MF-1 TaxID=1389203 RepID=A0A9Q3L0R3_9BASI|nr:hypothetical protein [Austropuccinia psidii MF-1]